MVHMIINRTHNSLFVSVNIFTLEALHAELLPDNKKELCVTYSSRYALCPQNSFS